MNLQYRLDVQNFRYACADACNQIQHLLITEAQLLIETFFAKKKELLIESSKFQQIKVHCICMFLNQKIDHVSTDPQQRN